MSEAKKKKQIRVIMSNPLDRREFIGYEMIDWAGKKVARLSRFFFKKKSLNGNKKDVKLTRSLEEQWDTVPHLDFETYKQKFIAENNS